MSAGVLRGTALVGASLVCVYTALIAAADAITKFIAGGYAAPQLFALSGLVVAGLCLVSHRVRPHRRGLRTDRPWIMAWRAGLTVVGSAAFFHAFRLLPFADVFLFIGLMPICAALLSGPILGERVRPAAWAALAAGAVGMLCLFPGGLAQIGPGHAIALAACLCGTLSMVLARLIGRTETNSLAQVLYPNLALGLAMAVALPFVYRPMPLADLGWVLAYAGLLFAARWVLVVSLRLLAAYAVMPLMNLQFVWMAVLGVLVFGEIPALGTMLGAAIVIGSGLVLIYDQMVPATATSTRPNRAKVAT